MRVQLGILQCIFLGGTAITVLKAPLPAYANDLLVTGALPVQPDIVVSQDGTGDFTSVSAAVESIPKENRERKIIFIKDGVYVEAVRIDASNVTLHGESRTGTRIEAGPAQEKGGNDRPGIVVAVNGNDVVLENLTIKNTHGVIGVHDFAVFGRGDRTIIQDADVFSHGNDTIALWRSGKGQSLDDSQYGINANGRYYHARLKVHGSVDFVCPRGWCYMTDSELIEVNPKASAAMWHDGSRDKDTKFVMVRCRFQGPTEGFTLARHHHDAMFFFIDCSFSSEMRDTAPARVVYPTLEGPDKEANAKKNKELAASNLYGERNYYFNSHRDGGDYAWHANNLSTAIGSPTREQVTARWTFANAWDPERKDPPELMSVASGTDGMYTVTFSEPVTVRGMPRLSLSADLFAEYHGGSGTRQLTFQAKESPTNLTTPKLDIHGATIIACEASSTLRFVR